MEKNKEGKLLVEPNREYFQNFFNVEEINGEGSYQEEMRKKKRHLT